MTKRILALRQFLEFPIVTKPLVRISVDITIMNVGQGRNKPVLMIIDDYSSFIKLCVKMDICLKCLRTF